MTIAGQEVHLVDGNGLVKMVIIMEHKELVKRESLRAILRDAGYSISIVKITIELIVKLTSHTQK